MLAAPLLRVAIRKDMIMPRFCTKDDELELAQKMIEAFKDSYKSHEKKSELYDRISAIESSHVDYKLVRGFYALLERRSSFNANGANASFTPNNIDDNDSSNNIESNDTSETFSRVATTITPSSDPVEVRRMLFEESAKRGFALTDLEREDIIKSIGEKLRVLSPSYSASLDTRIITEAMWSDLDVNLTFEHFDNIDSKTLVGWYNLSLMQTLLFNATKMEFRISGGANWKRVLRNVKRLGLMYYLDDRIDDNNSNNNFSSIVCSLEGPLSLFKLTDRYGTSLAKLLPSIVLSKQTSSDYEDEDVAKWEICGWIMRRTMMQGKKLYRFKMSSKEAPQLLADPFSSSSHYSESQHGHYFDSIVEEKFARKFHEVVEAATTGWRLVREPDPLIVADGKAFIPDFMFEKYGARVYLEIVGFWTPEYLERKLQKIRAVFNSRKKKINASNDNSDYDGCNNNCNNNNAVKTTGDMFIAIDEDLAGAKVSSFSASSTTATSFSSSVPKDRLIFYKNNSVPIRPILDYLKVLDKEMVERKTKDPNLRIQIDRSKDVISLNEVVQKQLDSIKDSIPIEVIFKIASRDYGGQYMIVGGNSNGTGEVKEEHQRNNNYDYYLISRSKANKLESMLKDVSTFIDACSILSDNVIPEPCHAELLDKLGYKVIWRSMDASEAVIERKTKNNNVGILT
jgi:predicted nuclease of restriction endonuclease-like RecB superfamily